MTGEKIDFTKDSEYIRLYGHPKSVHIEILEKEVEHVLVSKLAPDDDKRHHGDDGDAP